jgi:NADH-quinone oxidoreductase subunit E
LIKALSPKVCAAIDQMMAKYPPEQRQAAILSALMLMQKQNHGWLSTEIMDQVADYIGMPKIAVYEVASFYSLFELKPVGKHKICVCTNISCMLRGSDQIVDHLKSKLKINLGETTVDGRFTVKSVECLAACGGAPMMQIGDIYYENLTPAKLDTILDGLE